MPSFRKRHSFHSPFSVWTQLEFTCQSTWTERVPASLMSSDQGPYLVKWQWEKAKHTDVQCTQTTLTKTTGLVLVSQSAWQGCVEWEDACFRRSVAKEPCQKAMSTKLDSWWFGDHGAGKKVWDLVSDNQGDHACTWGSATMHVLVRVEGREVCVFSPVTVSPVSQRGERNVAVGTRVSPVQRHCWSCCWLNRKAAATSPAWDRDTRSPRWAPAGRRMPSPRAMGGNPFL